MRSFLEFVCTKKLGKPIGTARWRCPYCDPEGDHRPTFTVRPPKPGCKVRFACHRCGKWGDDLDLLKLLHPADDYDQRLARVAKLRQEWDRSPWSSSSSSRGECGENIDTFAKLLAMQVREDVEELGIGDLTAWKLVGFVFSRMRGSSTVTPDALLASWKRLRIAERRKK